MRELQKQMCDIEQLIAKLVKDAYDKGYEDGMNASDKTLLPTLPYGLHYSDSINCLTALPTRALNCLNREGIKTITDLANCTKRDLLRVRNFGAGTASRTIYILKTMYGINIKGEGGDEQR